MCKIGSAAAEARRGQRGWSPAMPGAHNVLPMPYPRNAVPVKKECRTNDEQQNCNRRPAYAGSAPVVSSCRKWPNPYGNPDATPNPRAALKLEKPMSLSTSGGYCESDGKGNAGGNFANVIAFTIGPVGARVFRGSSSAPFTGPGTYQRVPILVVLHKKEILSDGFGTVVRMRRGPAGSSSIVTPAPMSSFPTARRSMLACGASMSIPCLGWECAHLSRAPGV